MRGDLHGIERTGKRRTFGTWPFQHGVVAPQDAGPTAPGIDMGD